MDKIKKAYEQMSKIPNGPIEGDVDNLVLAIISSIWTYFPDHDDTSMSSDKLLRWENPEWNDPFLTFKIERHGGTVNGSSRAFVHTWQVDFKQGIAKIIHRTHRQLEQASKRLNVKPLAEKCSQLIESEAVHELLKWSHGGQRVQIQISKVIVDDGYQQTVAGRRKRFRLAVDELLGNDWLRVARPHNTWEKIMENR